MLLKIAEIFRNGNNKNLVCEEPIELVFFRNKGAAQKSFAP